MATTCQKVSWIMSSGLFRISEEQGPVATCPKPIQENAGQSDCRKKSKEGQACFGFAACSGPSRKTSDRTPCMSKPLFQMPRILNPKPQNLSQHHVEYKPEQYRSKSSLESGAGGETGTGPGMISVSISSREAFAILPAERA